MAARFTLMFHGARLLAPGKQNGGDPSDSEEEGRSDSQAAASECDDAGRTTPDSGDDERSAPESGTRDRRESPPKQT